jgi:formylglycine-generating enzyme required for sulfatase activity
MNARWWVAAALALAMLGAVGCTRGDQKAAAPEPPAVAHAENESAPEVNVPGGPVGLGCAGPDHGRCAGQYRDATVATFFIDKFEVTAVDFDRCLKAGVCQSAAPTGYEVRPGLPAQYVRQGDAAAYCGWIGKRLPTSREWEKAARGDRGGHTYPWGDEWKPNLANWCDGQDCDGSEDGHAGAAPVDAFADGASPYGALNMAGNMLEWTATQDTMTPGFFVVRGGSYGPPNNDMARPHFGLVSWLSFNDPARGGAEHMGFRCARSAD